MVMETVELTEEQVRELEEEIEILRIKIQEIEKKLGC